MLCANFKFLALLVQILTWEGVVVVVFTPFMNLTYIKKPMKNRVNSFSSNVTTLIKLTTLHIDRNCQFLGKNRKQNQQKYW